MVKQGTGQLQRPNSYLFGLLIPTHSRRNDSADDLWITGLLTSDLVSITRMLKISTRARSMAADSMGLADVIHRYLAAATTFARVVRYHDSFQRLSSTGPTLIRSRNVLEMAGTWLRS